MGACDVASCPQWNLPEFAFIGRSNVGKSSLVNMLTGHSSLAKVSATPGKTQQLNFFEINATWALVDLPGYGFAKVALSKKSEFNRAAADYIQQRSGLRHLFVLIDSRLPPQAIDLGFLAWLAPLQVAHTLVFTKADKQSARKTTETVEQFLTSLDEHRLPSPQAIVTSVKSKDGRKPLLAVIANLLD